MAIVEVFQVPDDASIHRLHLRCCIRQEEERIDVPEVDIGVARKKLSKMRVQPAAVISAFNLVAQVSNKAPVIQAHLLASCDMQHLHTLETMRPFTLAYHVERQPVQSLAPLTVFRPCTLARGRPEFGLETFARTRLSHHHCKYPGQKTPVQQA